MSTDGPSERVLRIRIGMARERHHQRACQFVSLDAGEISHRASAFAAAWAFRRAASRPELETVLRVLAWLDLAAGALEQLEGRNGE